MQYKQLVTRPIMNLDAESFYLHKLEMETDPSDVYTDLKNNIKDFVLVDVRSKEHYVNKHAQSAIHLPYSQMTKKNMSTFPADTLFIVYCWGPGCNGSTKAALKLSRLGYSVKEMIGGIEYWEKEGYPTQSGTT